MRGVRLSYILLVIVVVVFCGLVSLSIVGSNRGRSVPPISSSGSSVSKGSSSSSSIFSSASSSSDSSEVSTGDAQPSVSLTKDEAYLQSMIFNATPSGSDDVSLVNSSLESLLSGISGETLATLKPTSANHLEGTDINMSNTLYLFFIFGKYQLDTGYTRVWVSDNQPNSLQVIFKGHRDGFEDTYFLAYYNKDNSQFQISVRSGGYINGEGERLDKD